MKLTPAMVRYRVRAIEAVKRDFEAAHALEDSLHQDVLQHIVDHPDDDNIEEMASDALDTRKIEFARCCA